MAASYVPSALQPPAAQREFRGVWIATRSNLDWPSKPGLPVPQQKAELLAILDRAEQLNLNAVILQVRPACDALYASKIDPWSEYLSGKMGVAPKPLYDPLTLAVTEAHHRGLELHAWFNPFRARYTGSRSEVAANHISRTRPDLVKTWGQQLWLDPGEAAAQDYALSVILDVVRRYDIDGIHLDDYFYPYPDADTAGKEFPDDPSWKRYQARGGKLKRDDWRRENINIFVQHLGEAIHKAKPFVKLGVSPFGIWQPGYPEKTRGMNAYATLYADARLWLNNGWLDYCAPQLYWSIESPDHGYVPLLKWWLGENKLQRHLWPGIKPGNLTELNWSVDEIVQQVGWDRKLAAADMGVVHYSMTSLMGRHGDTIARNVYGEPALIPVTSWLDNIPPGKPRLYAGGNATSGTVTFTWEATGKEKAALWLVQSLANGRWSSRALGGDRTGGSYTRPAIPEAVAVSAVDRCGNISPPVVLERKTK